MSGCHNPANFFEFDAADIREAVRAGRLLSLEIEFSRRCNFRCAYCYVGAEQPAAAEMTPDEIRGVLGQAHELGARRVIVLGGEPMIYPQIREMIEFLRGLDIEVEMFTNGTNVTAEAARFLFERGVRVVLKMNTRNEQLQDKLSGAEGASRIIREAFDNLKSAGYPAAGRVLAVSTVICQDNAGEIVELWQWLRDQGIAPYFEMLTPHGSAADHPWLAVEPGAAEAIFRAVCELDRTRYGLEWGPQPPLVGGRCLRHQFSCLVTAAGDVFPCVGVTIPLGNVRERRLAEIIRDSEVLQDLRNYRQTVKGPCRECERAAECYGCRGTAYQLTGDYLASDPSCWRNRERQQAIERFPIPIDGMLPQRAPMRVVDRLLRVGERTAEVEWVVDARSPFVRPDGAVDPSVYLELMAQSIAALNGFRENGRGGREPRGLLLGARGIQVNGCARVGDRLVVHVNKYARYGGFGLVRSRVVRDGEVLASGEVKVWHQGDEADPAAPAAAADGNARPA